MTPKRPQGLSDATSTRPRAHGLDAKPFGWHADLVRAYGICGRTVFIRLSPLRRDDGALRWEVIWTPGKPERLTAADVEAFDRFRQQAIRELTAELEALRGPSQASNTGR